MERLIQKIKSRLYFVKDAAQEKFNLQASNESVTYKLRICRKKTIKKFQFQAHFDKKNVDL